MMKSLSFNPSLSSDVRSRLGAAGMDIGGEGQTAWEATLLENADAPQDNGG